MRRVIKDEDRLWEVIKPCLRGRWERLEVIVPDGLPDCMGLWNRATWWSELKVGAPNINKLRPKQIDFGYQCIKRGIPIFSCFGHKGRVLWFKDFDFERVVVPAFYRPLA